MINSQLQLANYPKGVTLTLTDNQYLLTIDAGVQVKEPVELRFPDSDFSAALMVRASENAKATLIERFEGARNIDYKLTVQAAKNADLKVITFQNLDPGSTFNELRSTDVQAGGNVHFINFQLGAKKACGAIHQTSTGESGTLNTDLLCRAKNDQEFDFDVKNAYDAKNGLGKIFVKGIALDESRLKMNGTIQITRLGGGTDTYLKQDSLLLSDKAKINAIPGLKIDTNEVKASHGASIVNLNEDALFYLTSRGISREEARKMMIMGFVSEQLNKINNMPELKEYILTHI